MESKVFIYFILFLCTLNTICSQQPEKKKNKEKDSCFPCWPRSSKNKTAVIAPISGPLEGILKHNALGPLILAYAGFCNRTIQFPLCNKADGRYYPPVLDMEFRDHYSKLVIRFRGRKNITRLSTTEQGKDAELDLATNECANHEHAQLPESEWQNDWRDVQPIVSVSNNGLTVAVTNGTFKSSWAKKFSTAGNFPKDFNDTPKGKEQPEIILTVDAKKVLGIIYGTQKADAQNRVLKDCPNFFEPLPDLFGFDV